MGIRHYDYSLKHNQWAYYPLEQARALLATGMSVVEVGRALRVSTGTMIGGMGGTLMADYERSGRQVFEVAPAMAAMFAMTELNGIDEADVRLPYSTFWLDVASAGWKAWGGERTQWHPLQGAYISGNRNPDGTLSLIVMVWGSANEASMGRLDDAILWGYLLLRSGDNIEDKLIAMFAGGGPFHSEALKRDRMDSPHAEEQHLIMRQVMRVAINMSLYLASEDPDVTRVVAPEIAELEAKLTRVKSPSKRKVVERLLEQKRRGPRVTLVGARSESRLRAALEQGNRAGPRAHWVRGHWRSYRVGRGRTELRRKWIQPFVRGGEEGEAPETRTYRVRGPGDPPPEA
jgi:hypothetical protein